MVDWEHRCSAGQAGTSKMVATGERYHSAIPSQPFFVLSIVTVTIIREPQSLELGVRHTLAFVVFASGMLLLLFFFDLGLAVTLLFCLSATTATGTILVLPGMRRVRTALVDYGLLWGGECWQTNRRTTVV